MYEFYASVFKNLGSKKNPPLYKKTVDQNLQYKWTPGYENPSGKNVKKIYLIRAGLSEILNIKKRVQEHIG